ncbi:MAG: hypothetical protein KC503_34620 [Myxococcales bacterium]|nr:hypothetical protein [Myxococcales bacterium]
MSTSAIAVIVDHAARARQTARLLQAAGMRTEVAEGGIDGLMLADECAFVLAPISALQALDTLTASRGVPLLLMRDEGDPTHIAAAAETASVGGLIGLRYPGAAPRAWELLSLARRLRSSEPPPVRAPLSWGATYSETELSRTAQRDALTTQVEQYAEPLVGPRKAGRLAEVAHELIMNAMYDAPADAQGRPLFAADRKADITLEPAQRPRFGYGCDGERFVLSARDPFGRLSRKDFFGGLARGVGKGRLDTSGGGAGLGFTLMHDGGTLLFADVVPGKLTQVVVVLELDVPTRELRTLPRSLHYFEHRSAA